MIVGGTATAAGTSGGAPDPPFMGVLGSVIGGEAGAEAGANCNDPKAFFDRPTGVPGHVMYVVPGSTAQSSALLPLAPALRPHSARANIHPKKRICP